MPYPTHPNPLAVKLRGNRFQRQMFYASMPLFHMEGQLSPLQLTAIMIRCQYSRRGRSRCPCHRRSRALATAPSAAPAHPSLHRSRPPPHSLAYTAATAAHSTMAAGCRVSWRCFLGASSPCGAAAGAVEFNFANVISAGTGHKLHPLPALMPCPPADQFVQHHGTTQRGLSRVISFSLTLPSCACRESASRSSAGHPGRSPQTRCRFRSGCVLIAPWRCANDSRGPECPGRTAAE